MMYAFLASSCGWTFGQIREMTPREQGVVIDKMLVIEKQKQKSMGLVSDKWVARR